MQSTIEQRNPFRNWHMTQQCFGNYATDELGREINPKNPTACRWCALGWLKFIGTDPMLVTMFNSWCVDNLGGKTIAELNDVDSWLPVNFEQAWNRFMKESIEAAFKTEV